MHNYCNSINVIYNTTVIFIRYWRRCDELWSYEKICWKGFFFTLP